MPDDRIQLSSELQARVIALARATGGEPSTVLERLLEFAFGYSDSLGAGADLPPEITLVKLHDFAHSADEYAGYASALMDGLDGGEFDFAGRIELIVAELQDAEELRDPPSRQRLLEYLKAQLHRDFFNDPSA